MLGKKLLDENGRNLLPVGSEHFLNEIVENASFDGENYSDCQFERVQLKNLNLHSSFFTNCHFEKNYWYGVNLKSCTFINCTFEHNVWKEVVFDGCKFAGCEFKSSTLDIKLIHGIGFDLQCFDDCLLTGQFKGVVLKKAEQVKQAA